MEVDPEDIHVTFDDVKGADEAKQELKDVVEFLKNPEKFSNLGGKLPKGVLLVGPPGTEKFNRVGVEKLFFMFVENTVEVVRKKN